MNKLFVRLFLALTSFVVTSFLLLSCINEDYDLSKGVDMDVHILHNTSIPVGNFTDIPVVSLFGDAGTDNSVFFIDEDGNIALFLTEDVITQTFSMPKVDIGGEGGLQCSDFVTVNFKPIYKGTDIGGMKPSELPSDIPDKIHFSDDAEGGYIIEKSFDIELHKLLPDEVIDVARVNLNSIIQYSFEASEGVILHLKKGFEMEFPEFMTIQSAAGGQPYVLDENNPHIVRLVDDIMITEDKPLVLNIGFTAIDVPAGSVNEVMDSKTGLVNRFVDIKDKKIIATGDIYLMPADYVAAGLEIIPEVADMVMHVGLDDMKMKSANVKLDMELEEENRRFDVDVLSEIFNAEGNNIDFYNPILKFHFVNGSPLNMNMNADIVSYSANGQTFIHIGDEGSDPVLIPSTGEAEYYFSRQGKHGGKSGIDVKIEEIGDILSEIPDSIIIKDVKFEPEDKFIEIYPDQECTISMEYDLYSHMAFGRDMKVELEHDLDMEFNNGVVGIDSLVINMTIVNTIPLSFEIKGVALDHEGNEAEDIDVSMNFKMEAGTLANPAESPVRILVWGRSSNANMSKLRLKLKAESSKEVEGEVFNTAQGLSINDVSINLPNGIVINGNKYEESDL